jgi:hypothetical protein
LRYANGSGGLQLVQFLIPQDDLATGRFEKGHSLLENHAQQIIDLEFSTELLADSVQFPVSVSLPAMGACPFSTHGEAPKKQHRCHNLKRCDDHIAAVTYRAQGNRHIQCNYSQNQHARCFSAPSIGGQKHWPRKKKVEGERQIGEIVPRNENKRKQQQRRRHHLTDSRQLKALLWCSLHSFPHHADSPVNPPAARVG